MALRGCLRNSHRIERCAAAWDWRAVRRHIKSIPSPGACPTPRTSCCRWRLATTVDGETATAAEPTLSLAQPLAHNVTWILPEGHVSLPKTFTALNVRVYRLRSHPRIAPVRHSRSAVVAWDWRRAAGPSTDWPEDAIAS